MMRSMMIVTTQDDTLSHLANGTLKKKFELYFTYLPTKYVIPKSLKFSHWPSK